MGDVVFDCSIAMTRVVAYGNRNGFARNFVDIRKTKSFSVVAQLNGCFYGTESTYQGNGYGLGETEVH